MPPRAAAFQVLERQHCHRSVSVVQRGSQHVPLLGAEVRRRVPERSGELVLTCELIPWRADGPGHSFSRDDGRPAEEAQMRKCQPALVTGWRMGHCGRRSEPSFQTGG